MTLAEVLVVVFEVAAAVLVQATHVGGPIAVTGAGAVLFATVVFLFARGRRRSLSERIDRFLADRRAREPVGADAGSRADYETDTLDCFRSVFGRELRLATQKLRQEGIIGRIEATSWNNPTTVDDIERIVARLSDYETRR